MSIAGNNLHYPIHRVFIDGGGVGGLSGVAGAGRFDSTRYGADGGAVSADRQRRVVSGTPGWQGSSVVCWATGSPSGPGWRFKKPLHRWSFLKKNKALLIKLNMRCINTACSPFWSVVLLARRVRWCQWWREWDLPVAKFDHANIIGCLLWPPFYLPGILAGAAIDIPAGMQR